MQLAAAREIAEDERRGPLIYADLDDALRSPREFAQDCRLGRRVHDAGRDEAGQQRDGAHARVIAQLVGSQGANGLRQRHGASE